VERNYPESCWEERLCPVIAVEDGLMLETIHAMTRQNWLTVVVLSRDQLRIYEQGS
jgi:hypothetical protein